MRFIIFITSLIVCIETVNYGVYEFKKLNNKSGGTSIIIISIFMVLFINTMLFFR